MRGVDARLSSCETTFSLAAWSCHEPLICLLYVTTKTLFQYGRYSTENSTPSLRKTSSRTFAKFCKPTYIKAIVKLSRLCTVEMFCVLRCRTGISDQPEVSAFEGLRLINRLFGSAAFTVAQATTGYYWYMELAFVHRAQIFLFLISIAFLLPSGSVYESTLKVMLHVGGWQTQ